MNFEQGAMESGAHIVLPNNPELVEKLEEKLAEYEQRRDRSFKAPEEPEQMDVLCKIAVLSALLKEGSVNTELIENELMERYKTGFNKEIFRNACGVIKGYAERAGEGLVGGTGL